MFDWQSLIKYILEGLAVAVAMYIIAYKKVEYADILLVGLTAAAVFAILDQFSPYVAVGARQGSGFILGYQQVGFGNPDQSICQMKNGECTYQDNLPDDQMQKYLCRQEGDRCVPMSACPQEGTNAVAGFAGFAKTT